MDLTQFWVQQAKGTSSLNKVVFDPLLEIAHVYMRELQVRTPFAYYRKGGGA